KMNGEPPEMDGEHPDRTNGKRQGMPPEMSEEMNEEKSEISQGTNHEKRGMRGQSRDQSSDGAQNTGEEQNRIDGFGDMRGDMGGRPESTEISTEHHIQINGGTLLINAEGDGVDSNGSLVMDGGYVAVNGPSRGGNSAIDHDGLCLINGGTLIAVGEAGMIENPSGTSGQYVISAYMTKSCGSGELVTICDSEGKAVISMAPLKSYGHIMFSSDALKEGETYTVYEGGACTGTLNAASGVYDGGSLEGGDAGASGTAGSDSKLITVR
ncbi:MAG: hypothetical protein Q4G33_13675, partial [bacterium]|nr:hypothetical protein [bacterium]